MRSKKHFLRGGIPYHLAVIFDAQRVICWGVNDVVSHAEITAIRRFRTLKNRKKIKRFSHYTLIVVRIRRTMDGRSYFGLSMPCARCASAINCSGLFRVLWSNGGDSGEFSQCRPCDLASSHTSRAYR